MVDDEWDGDELDVSAGSGEEEELAVAESDEAGFEEAGDEEGFGGSGAEEEAAEERDEEEFDYSDLENDDEGDGQGEESKVTKKMREEHRKAKAVNQVESAWRALSDAVVKEGKELFEVNRLPLPASLVQFEEHNPAIKAKLASAKLGLLGLISDLQTLKSAVSSDRAKDEFAPFMAAVSKQELKVAKKPQRDGRLSLVPLTDRLDTGAVFEQLEKSFAARSKYYEEVSQTWFTKTNIQSSSKDKVVLQKLSQMQLAPFKAASSSLEDSAKILEKVHRLPQGVTRLLGSLSGAELLSHPAVYSDQDLLTDLAASAQQSSSYASPSAAIHPYHQNRQAKKKLTARQATKDRKMQFTEHEKLVSFMSAKPYEGTVLEGRDDIIKALFGVSVDRPLLGKRLPLSELAGPDSAESREVDDIQLI